MGTRGHEDRRRRFGLHLGRARLAPECGCQVFISLAPTVINAHDTNASPARLCLRKRTINTVVITYCTIMEILYNYRCNLAQQDIHESRQHVFVECVDQKRK